MVGNWSLLTGIRTALQKVMAWALSPCPEADDISTGELLSTFNKKIKLNIWAMTMIQTGTEKEKEWGTKSSFQRNMLVQNWNTNIWYPVFFRSVNKSFDTKFEKLTTKVIFVGKKLLVIKFLVSKETVVLYWRENETNELIKVEFPLWKIWKADISSVSPLWERSDEGLMSALQIFRCGNYFWPLSTRLIKPNN